MILKYKNLENMKVDLHGSQSEKKSRELSVGL